jgi:hypothetical protein
MQKTHHLAWIIIFTSFLLILVGHHNVALAQDVSKSPALIFYEIRGDRQEEGTLPKDIDSIKNSGQSVTFLWTYTKLFDESAISLVRGLNTYQGGVLLEVDDLLRKDAGVTKDTLWPTSVRDVERTTILGYSQSDRRKLVDTLVRKYISVFGQAPQVAGSRIIDTPTANYLKDTYGIRFQIIDEEYKDKDHSMLDGGPSLIPYPASANWLLVPDHSNPDPIWIIRRPPTDIDYSLVGGDGITQIYIFSNISSAKNITTATKTGRQPHELPLILQSHQSLDPSAIPELHPNDISFTSYGSIDVKLYEVTTSIYRMRILRNKADMWITDVRLYNKNLIDPYTSRVARYGYYIVVPYLLNETGWKDNKIAYLDYPDRITHFTLPNIDSNKDNVGEINTGRVGDDVAYIMQYKSDSPDNRKVVIAFNKDTIQIVGFNKSTRKLPYTPLPHALDPIRESRDNISWMFNGKKIFGANLNCSPDSCEITFNTQNISLYNNLFDKQPLFTFPEPELLNSNSKVTLGGNAQATLVGEKTNILLVSQSQSGLSVVSSTKAIISTSQPAILSTWQKDSIYESSYFTVTGKEPVDMEVLLTQGDHTLRDSITIIPNCSQNWLTCIKSPKSLFSYLFR